MSSPATPSPSCEFSMFPCVTGTIKQTFKPKIIKSSKKTRKIKKFINESTSTQVQVYESDLEVIKPRGLIKKSSKILSEDSLSMKKKGMDPDSFPKKMKELSKSLQIMSLFIILMKLYAIIVKRVNNIQRGFVARDFRYVWRQIMLIFTELAKYLKDLTMKAKIVKSNDAKSLALLTESFYKSIKIYENMRKKNKSLIGLLWKLIKFATSLIKILINFDYIFPLEMFFPSTSLLVLAFGFKTFGILRKATNLIKAAIKRWALPKRRFVFLAKLMIVALKMIVAIFTVVGHQYLLFYLVSGQFTIHLVIFSLALREMISAWIAKAPQKKLPFVPKPTIVIEKIDRTEDDKDESSLVKKPMTRRIVETRMGKEEISI